MTDWTKRLLQGAGVSLLGVVLLGVFSRLAFGDSTTGAGPDNVWMVATLMEIATVGLLIGAGISFLVGRTGRKV